MGRENLDRILSQIPDRRSKPRDEAPTPDLPRRADVRITPGERVGEVGETSGMGPAPDWPYSKLGGAHTEPSRKDRT
jgi:hypothetical protein